MVDPGTRSRSGRTQSGDRRDEPETGSRRATRSGARRVSARHHTAPIIGEKRSHPPGRFSLHRRSATREWMYSVQPDRRTTRRARRIEELVPNVKGQQTPSRQEAADFITACAWELGEDGGATSGRLVTISMRHLHDGSRCLACHVSSLSAGCSGSPRAPKTDVRCR